jgi:tetratricopeptide (TPR) repeat protein
MNGTLAAVARTKRTSAAVATVTPEELLHRALVARSPDARARWAQRGLASRAPLDRTTHALLLRQLYMSHYEAGRFGRARELAEDALALRVMLDVFHHDAGEAALGEGALDAGLAHLRLAARSAPVGRRSFHLWTLGSALFLAGRYAEAGATLERAARRATRQRPLFRGHLALVRMAAGEAVDGLQTTIDELLAAPCGRGYGRFVLGHLAYAAGSWDAARRFLRAFVRRTEEGGPGRRHALRGELAMSRATLAKMTES